MSSGWRTTTDATIPSSGLEGRTVLVTGAGGFVGCFLVPLLEARGARVVGVYKTGLPRPEFGSHWIEADLAQPDEVRSLVRDVSPSRILHLAALAFPPDVARDPLMALKVNLGALDILLDEIAARAPETRVLVVGTGQAYGPTRPDADPWKEDAPLQPGNAYSATKAAAEQRAVLAFERDAIPVILARPMNHTGPGRPPDYVESAFARQLARIEQKLQEPVLRVGNLQSVRDFSDVRDVVEAYALLIEQGEPGAVYNISSGVGTEVRTLLDLLLKQSRARPAIEVDPALYRTHEDDRVALVADPARIRALGWRARFSLDETLKDLLEDWRTRV